MLIAGGMSSKRARDGASPNKRWLVCSIATVKSTAASPASTPTRIVSTRNSWCSRNRSCCALGRLGIIGGPPRDAAR